MLLQGYKDSSGGLVVSVLTFQSEDPSSNPAKVFKFSVKLVFEKNENKQREARVGPLCQGRINVKECGGWVCVCEI